ncbi:MAG: F0F1 ATP synthase subunit A [Prevotella sp.]|jgi:F-type H+-transporting ATPase subunit a|nr:F0F1 ATP synthase subunit A [Prevotella sp.]
MKQLKKYLFMLLLALSAMPGFAEKKDIDMKEILWGHIKDSYEWHVTNIGETPIVLHLPVIVHSSTGWHVFSSSEFSEELDAQGNRKGPFGLYIKSANDEKYPSKIVEMVDGQEVRPFDISITKTVCVLFIDAFILLLCILIPARWCRRHKVDDPAPKGFTGLMHMFIMSIYDDVVKAIMGKEADKYAPYLLTCFFFIFVANIMGIIPFPPGGGNLTGNIACTCFLGVATFLVTNLTGTKEYWKEIFWPDVPTWLKVPVPLMPIIEIVGIFTKPLALVIRLFANMMAGHAIALAFAGMIFIMFHLTTSDVVNNVAGSGISVVSVALSIFMMLLEILVSYIQALVFTMLSAVFISFAHVKEHE